MYDSLVKPGRHGELLEDRPHIIESGFVQDMPQRLTRIDLRPRFDDLAIFIVCVCVCVCVCVFPLTNEL